MSDTITLPDWFDRAKFLEPFKTKSTLELYAHFDCKNSTSFSMMMKKYFPNKPDRMPYDKYVRKLLETEPRVQQLEQPNTSKSFLSATGGEPEVVPEASKITLHTNEWDEPAPSVQPRIRTEDDIWLSKQLFKEAGRTHQNSWLKAGHPDPLKETIDAPYDEQDVFTNLS